MGLFFFAHGIEAVRGGLHTELKQFVGAKLILLIENCGLHMMLLYFNRLEWKTMRHLKFFLIMLMTTAFAADFEQRHIEDLREGINTKRLVTIKELGGNFSIGGKFSISGEVRAEFQSTHEKKNGVKQQGSDGEKPNSATHACDLEVNLMLNYRADRTWATVKIEFDNNAGMQLGAYDSLRLEKAFLGGRIVDADTYTMDLEIGRRHLFSVFDSEIEFGSFMDGILYKYDQTFEKVGDFYFHGGPFLVNETLDHYAYVGELGLLNIGRTGLYTKLSAVYWDTKHTDEKGRNAAFRFLPIQWIWGYKFTPKVLHKIVTTYAAALYNPRARGTVVSNGHRNGWAAYTGFSIGELDKQWDWFFNVNAQWVQMQAVPDFDGLGIGRGNALGRGLYTESSGGVGSLNKEGEGVGDGNYKGFTVELSCLVTNNITIYQAWSQSINLWKSIHPNFSYKRYEFEIIYAF